MHTIVGAGGVIGTELLKELTSSGKKVRLVGRHVKPAAGISEVIPADVSKPDEAGQAIAGSSVVYLTVGLKYDIKVWREFWPPIMRNTIEACKRAKAKLIFFKSVL